MFTQNTTQTQANSGCFDPWISGEQPDIAAFSMLPSAWLVVANSTLGVGGIVDDCEDDVEESECARNYSAALKWFERGLNVVPQKAVDTKHPAVAWKEFQNRRVTKADLSKWYQLFANGLGFITGAVSGVIIIESDGPAGEDVLSAFEAEHGPLPATLTVLSGSGRGYHRYFIHPGYPVTTKANTSIKLDVKGDKGFAVLPPSLHKSGGRYTITNDVEPASLPEGLLDFIEARSAEAQGIKVAGARGKEKAGPVSGEFGMVPEYLQPVFDQQPNIHATPPPPETDEEISKIKSALAAISADIERADWMAICFGVLWTGWSCAEGLIMDWSRTGTKTFTEDGFWNVVNSYDPDRRPQRTLGTVYAAAQSQGWVDPTKQLMDSAVSTNSNPGVSGAVIQSTTKGLNYTDFVSLMESPMYILKKTGAFWPASKLDGRFGYIYVKEKKVSVSKWLDKNQPADQVAWAPAEPQIILDKIYCDGGWQNHPGMSCYNQYRPPIRHAGDAEAVEPWLNHVMTVYPKDWEHLVNWFAQRVQRPWEKINHALVLGGEPGIGKDSLLVPLEYGVGEWNVRSISPASFFQDFNGYLEAVVLKIEECADLGGESRYSLYEKMKVVIAESSKKIMVNKKHMNPYAIPNCVSNIITTNHRTGGLYLPANDRRHYVAYSDLPKGYFSADYFDKLHTWYENGGNDNVVAYLEKLSLANFNPKAEPLQTDAFWDMVNSDRSPDELEMADAIDALGHPDALILKDFKSVPNLNGDFSEWLDDRKNIKQIVYRLRDCGYIKVSCQTSPKDGRWQISPGRKEAIYAKRGLSEALRHGAATAKVKALNVVQLSAKAAGPNLKAPVNAPGLKVVT